MMCFGNPAKSLEIARACTTPEQWAAFEREFSVFCDIHGLPDKWAYWPTYDWARWTFWCARPKETKPASAFQCAARKQGSAGGNMHADCDWPLCGCDEYASEVIAALQECDLLKEPTPHPPIKIRLADAHFERIAIAMMSDEQAEQSLERWRGVKGEAE